MFVYKATDCFLLTRSQMRLRSRVALAHCAIRCICQWWSKLHVLHNRCCEEVMPLLILVNDQHPGGGILADESNVVRALVGLSIALFTRVCSIEPLH